MCAFCRSQHYLCEHPVCDRLWQCFATQAELDEHNWEQHSVMPYALYESPLLEADFPGICQMQPRLRHSDSHLARDGSSGSMVLPSRALSTKEIEQLGSMIMLECSAG